MHGPGVTAALSCPLSSACGKKALCNARFDESGHVIKEGEQVVLGANDQYIGLCRKHWMAGDLGPDFRPEDLL